MVCFRVARAMQSHTSRVNSKRREVKQMKNTKSLIIAIVAALAIAVGVLGHSGNAFVLNREIVVYNNTRSTMRELLASNIGDNIWRWDFLGYSTLPAGYHVTVNIDDRSGYCRY